MGEFLLHAGYYTDVVLTIHVCMLRYVHHIIYNAR